MSDMAGLTPMEWEALRLSLWVSLWAVAGSLPIGILAAWVLARLHFPGKSLLDGIVHLPLVLPPVVTGYALLILFGRKGPLGAFLRDHLGLTLAFNWKGRCIGGGRDGLSPVWCGRCGSPLKVWIRGSSRPPALWAQDP